MEPFTPRRIDFHGVRVLGPWRLKMYSVAYEPGPIDWDAFAPGLALVTATLPLPDAAAGRPGVGFQIAHQGRTGNYAVLCWWDRENELPLRVYVSPEGRADDWRPNTQSESICVWDLEILWAERQAYVSTMLGATGSDVDGYLARSFAAPTPPAGVPPPLDYDGRVFRSVSNSEGGDVSAETTFYYRQRGNVVSASYEGGAVLFGTLLAIEDDRGHLDMRYQHLSQDGTFKSGRCHSRPEIHADGRIRLHEEWEWTAGADGRGHSIVEEV